MWSGCHLCPLGPPCLTTCCRCTCSSYRLTRLGKIGDTLLGAAAAKRFLEGASEGNGQGRCVKLCCIVGEQTSANEAYVRGGTHLPLWDETGATDGPVNGAVDGGTAAAYVSLGAWAADERVFRPSQSVGPVDIQQLDASCMCVISDFMRMATLLEGRCIHGIFGFFGSSGPGSRSSERV